MRVAITAGVYYPEIGGSGTYLHRLRGDLLAAGHEVRIVCFGEGPSEPGIVRITRRSPIPLRLFRFTHAALRTLSGCDVWYVNDYGLSAALLAPLHRRPMAMKVIGDWAWESAVNQGLVAPPDGSGRADPLVELERRRQHPRVEARKVVRRRSAMIMDRVVVPSAYLADIVAQWGVRRERIRVIHNGVDVVARGAAVAPREPGLVVTAARLVAWKGLGHLLRALSLVRRELSARVVVLGDGPAREDLEDLATELGIAGAVTFAGLVDRTVVREHLARANVFVLPSAYEGLPHVVLEALAEGCPVIASDAGGTPEVIRDGIDGVLVPYGDPPALAEALLRVLRDDALVARLSRSGSRRIEQAFEWRATSRATIDLLSELAATGEAQRRRSAAGRLTG